MTVPENASGKPSFSSFKRKVIPAADILIDVDETEQAEPLTPVVIRPSTAESDMNITITAHRDSILACLNRRGAVLLRGFFCRDEARFEAFIHAISSQTLEYLYQSTPRKRVAGNVYTSTEYPPSQFIPLHNEMSYSAEWPMKIFFWSVVCAELGGETPIASSRHVLASLPKDLVNEFTRKGVLYVRNYSDDLDLPWQRAFQTTEREGVASVCEELGITHEWLPGNRLRTKQICHAVVKHPTSGEELWFNQAHLFHVSSLPVEVKDYLLSSYGLDGLPRNTYFGDGTSIPESALAAIRQAYNQHIQTFVWQPGDILMLDNMRVAHGRQPFSGNRKVLVGMSEPYRLPVT